MVILLPIHIIGGLLGLLSGTVAMYAVKGGKLHRQSGMIFVYAMSALGISGAAMAALEGETISVIGGMLTFYLVVTAMLTVRRDARKAGWIEAGLMLFGLVVGISAISFGIAGVINPTNESEYIPLGFIFGMVVLLSVTGDARLLLMRRIKETHRLSRHLTRMGIALFIAAGSFFLGQADLFPESIRITPLLCTPVLLVVVVTIYWVVRVLLTKWRPRPYQTV